MAQRCLYGAKMTLYALAALLPLLFLPAPFGIDFGREVVFGVLILAALMLWLVSALASGEVRFAHSPALYAAGAVALVFGVSALLSPSPYVAAFFADAPAERLSWLFLCLFAMIGAGGILQRREEGGTLLFILIFSGALSALMNAAQFLSGHSLLMASGLATGKDGNVIGTVNALALFYAALFVMTAGVLLSEHTTGWKRWVRVALVIAAALFFFDLALINFRTAWIVLVGAAVLLFGLLVMEGASRTYSARGIAGASSPSRRFGWRHWVALCLIVVPVLMLMTQGAGFFGLGAPAEVSPSLSATLSIAGSVFREGPAKAFFGSGPGSFGLAWARYKDTSINQTIFWGVRFTQGQSWLATVLPTAGVLGFAALIGFFVVTLVTFLRMLLSVNSSVSEASEGAAVMSGDMSEGDRGTLDDATERARPRDALSQPLFLGFAALSIGLFWYPANESLILLLFLMIGVLAAVAARRETSEARQEYASDEVSETGEILQGTESDSAFGPASAVPAHSPFWSVRERVIAFSSPWAVFASSLIIIFFLALSAIGIWSEATRVRVQRAAAAGVAAAAKGDVDEALRQFSGVVDLEPHDFRNLQALVQIRGARIQQLIARAAAGQNVQQDFQSAVSVAIQDAERMTDAYPENSSLWRTRGALYEMIIPYIQGSERFAVSSYQNASDREPQNPEIYVEWGRAGLVFTDRILALENQASAKDKDQLEAARKQNLEQIAGIFQRAIQVKQDFAPAHFLLAQTAIRLGNLDAAITSAENAKAAAPFDIGVAFQLGLLYYQKQDMDKAQAEFERAIATNDNYSNARYFLGLIYDKKGDKAHALEQFTKIAQLNPDNQEVKRITDNLTAGKTALDGIVPPAAPPEKRKDAPVKEKEQQK